MSNNQFRSLNDATILRDTTNTTPRGVGQFWGTRFKSTNPEQSLATPHTQPRTKPAATPKTVRHGPTYGDDSPASAARCTVSKDTAVEDASPALKFAPSPQRPLFHKYLLPEATHTERPVLTVVLDLDETLVSNRRADLVAAILRPYVTQALAALRQLPGVELVLWTASTEETGSPVVDQLQASQRLFDHVIFRNDTWFTEPIHTKDLRLLGRDMDRVIVVDNAPNCCKLNRDHALLVEDFTGAVDKRDATLINVFNVVQSLLPRLHAGGRVPEALAHLVNDPTSYCRNVYYALPPLWEQTNLRDISPLMVPPHGRFYKIASIR